MSQLNPHQELAVLHRQGPLLVLAGAGSGKTRIVTSRIAKMIEEGVSPTSILALTFTNKAAGEMQERVRRLTAHYVTICTFHSLGVRILRESITHLGYQRDFMIYDEDDSRSLLRSCLNTLGIKDKAVDLKVLKSMISNGKNNLKAPKDLDGHGGESPVEKAFPAVYSLYQAKLKECNALDFDDLLFLTVCLLRDHPDVLAFYQQRWSFVLIDEYQDTNGAQYLLAQMLVAKSRNLFVVGEPDQSIYSWRGANIANILNFERDYPGATVVRLEQNYRSSGNILNAANALIRNNERRYEKNLWSALGLGEKISLFIGEGERDEAFFVVNRILHHQKIDGIPFNECVIFYRTNFQSRVFEDALLRMRVPYVVVGGVSFYQRREIKDVLAFLRTVHSGADFVSFVRTINLPKRGIGDTTLENIREAAAAVEMPLFAYCEQLVTGGQQGSSEGGSIKLSAKQRKGLEEYIDLIHKLREVNNEESLQALVLATIRQSGYLEYLRVDDKETYEDRKENLEQLVAKAAEWDVQSEETPLQSFLEELSLKSTLDEVHASDDRVRLMTIHNGKGLEFKVTFLAGLEEDLFPHANSRGSFEKLEEERRLCYVGMTRAKERLYLSAVRNRFLWGTPRRMRPSRFLSEIPTEHLKKAEGT